MDKTKLNKTVEMVYRKCGYNFGYIKSTRSIYEVINND